MVEMNPDYSYRYGEGKVYGNILHRQVGNKSFGYDCVFRSDELGKAFGHCTKAQKNSVSHRTRAILDLFGKQ